MKKDYTKPIKIALYCRVAHVDEPSIDSQKEKLRAIVKAQGYDNFEFYLDNGESGLDFNRPAFSRLMEDIKIGNIGKVISLDISRIWHSTFEEANWIDNLRKRNIEFITQNQSHKEIDLLHSLVRTKKPHPRER